MVKYAILDHNHVVEEGIWRALSHVEESCQLCLECEESAFSSFEVSFLNALSGVRGLNVLLLLLPCNCWPSGFMNEISSEFWY